MTQVHAVYKELISNIMIDWKQSMDKDMLHKQYKNISSDCINNTSTRLRNKEN